MAKVVIIDNQGVDTKSISNKKYPITSFIADNKKSYININQPVVTRGLDRSDYPLVSFTTGERKSVVQGILPFRIRFTAIQIPGYSSANIPPIPLQIVGFSNYIL